MISKLALYGHIYKIQRTAVLKNFAHVAVFLWEILEGHIVRCKAIFPNFNSCSIEVWEWISNFIPHFIMSVITYQCWDYSYTMFVKGTPEIQLSLKSQDFLVTIYQGMLLWWPFLGLFNWNPLIQTIRLKIGYLIFHELQWINKHERVTGWLSQHWPPPACQFSFPIQKGLFSFHTTVLCIHLEKWHSKLVKYKWTELTFYHLTQQYCMPSAHWGWDKMCAISQTMFSNAFSWMKTSEFWIICHWNVFLKV